MASNPSTPIPVLFCYPKIAHLLLEDEKWNVGGAPCQMYALAEALARDSQFAVSALVDEPPLVERIQNIQLVYKKPPVKRFLPFVGRFVNRSREKGFAAHASGGVALFSVSTGKQILAQYGPMIHRVGGKVLYRIASDIDLLPELRYSHENNAWTRGLQEADCIIAQTEFQRRIAQERYGLESTVIPSAFVGTTYTSVKKDSILWVGQCYSYRRPWLVAQLAREFPDENFVMIMPKNDEALARVIEQEMELLDNVQLIDYVPVDKIQQYFDRAKLFINTSVFEGFPNTLLQSGAGHTPYISLSWNPDGLLESQGIGYGCQGSLDTMKTHMHDLLSNPVLSEAIGTRGSEYVREHHNLDKVVEMYKALIRRSVPIKPME